MRRDLSGCLGCHGGAHAMGDLAMASAIVGFAVARPCLLFSRRQPTCPAFHLSIIRGGFKNKSAALVCHHFSASQFGRYCGQHRPQVRRQVSLAIAAPWIIFYCPIALWTWAQSGSPFGPVLAGFGSSIYPDGWAQEVFREHKRRPRPPLMMVIKYTGVSYSPLVWLGLIGALFGSDLSRGTRVIFGFLFAFQFSLIYWLLPYDVRYLGGLHYGLLILFATYAHRGIQDKFGSARAVTIACILFLLPWVAIQAFYAKQFLPVVLGVEKAETFYRRYVAFYADFVKLDRILS